MCRRSLGSACRRSSYRTGQRQWRGDTAVLSLLNLVSNKRRVFSTPLLLLKLRTINGIVSSAHPDRTSSRYNLL